MRAVGAPGSQEVSNETRMLVLVECNEREESLGRTVDTGTGEPRSY
jgi:hypothetical protein